MQVKSRAALGQLSDMDIRLLRVFKSVVECGGMAAAELELNIGTSTVSRHIKDLETRLGLTLCRRGRAGFALTVEGQQIYTETLRLLAGVDAFRSSVDEIHRRMGGQLNIAVFDKTASNPQSHLSQAIALFTELAPEVSLHLFVAPLNTIERGVIDGQFRSASFRGTAAPIPWFMRSCLPRPCSCTAVRRMRCFRLSRPRWAGTNCAATLLPVWATTRPIWTSASRCT